MKVRLLLYLNERLVCRAMDDIKASTQLLCILLVMNKLVRTGPLCRLSHERRTSSYYWTVSRQYSTAVFIANDVHCFVLTDVLFSTQIKKYCTLNFMSLPLNTNLLSWLPWFTRLQRRFFSKFCDSIMICKIILIFF